ncbi:hypothetical protein PPTG_04768 [Phytophthora nicotianae INRA-310]|uniref:Uncharacterized protein n=1 Tax=Phytophthora nicotianae (strain INRA-310) TaxID=761204 RepID=W2R280_PHYN3|nr:hypothetical protein PPTG_04768 [Phytophthora nicotianae INRA-310]ETN19458.1 hypothetical protein PPTG_04768 [Phytophthora nicotianae INRA-310]
MSICETMFLDLTNVLKIDYFVCWMIILGAMKYRFCQESVEAHDLNTSNIYACASCCELIVCKKSPPVFVTIHDLPTTFRPTDAKFRLRYGSIGDTIRRKHCQLFEKDDQVYYINPDLVNYGNVVLYRTCARDPRSVTFSIANNHDYGHGDELPELNEVVMNCISPVRKFVVK